MDTINSNDHYKFFVTLDELLRLVAQLNTLYAALCGDMPPVSAEVVPLGNDMRVTVVGIVDANGKPYAPHDSRVILASTQERHLNGMKHRNILARALVEEIHRMEKKLVAKRDDMESTLSKVKAALEFSAGATDALQN